MKIVFMGTPEFAVESLKQIHESHHQVVGVVTATDKPAGRGQKLSFSAVKNFALEHNLNILQPESLKSQDFIDQLKALEADLFVVVAFRMLPEMVWKMPSKGTVNLHASLLPHYRGAAPINWAIINGEKETGATTFFIEEQIDTGNIIDQFKVDISDNMNAGELHDILMNKGAYFLVNTLDKIEKGTFEEKPQNTIQSENLKKAFKIFKETCEINWNEDAEKIHNLIRGLSPYPAAFTNLFINDKEFITKIYKSEICNDIVLNPKEIQTDFKNYFSIGTKNGAINILELQIAGKKRMDIKSFLNGNKESTFRIV